MIKHSLSDWLSMGLSQSQAAKLANMELPEHFRDRNGFEFRFVERLTRQGEHFLLAYDEFDTPLVMSTDGSLWLIYCEKPVFLQSGLEEFFRCEAAFEEFLDQLPLEEWSEERDQKESERFYQIISGIDQRAADESAVWSIRIEEVSKGVWTRD